MTHTHKLGRTPLEWRSARQRALYQTTPTHKGQTSMPPAVFELSIVSSELSLGLSDLVKLRVSLVEVGTE